MTDNQENTPKTTPESDKKPLDIVEIKPVLDPFKPQLKEIKHSSPLLANDFIAGVLIGVSRTGKTSILPDLLAMLHPYKYLILFVKRVQQPAYDYLIEKAKLDGTTVLIFDNLDYGVIEMRRKKLQESEHNVVIVDDYIGKDLDQAIKLYSAGRWDNISVFILCQNYFQIPDAIRSNATDLFVFQLGQNHMYTLRSLPIGGIIDMKQLKQLYNEVCNLGWKNFLWISSHLSLAPWMKIRLNFDGFLRTLLPDPD